MTEKTNSIVLHTIPYKDSMSIVHLFTEKKGKLACFLPVSKSKKSLIKSNMFQPLATLELEIDINSKKDIHRIKEAKIHFPLNQLLFHPIKLTLAQFIAEFINKTIHESEENQGLYRFFEHAIQILDLSDKSMANFHLVFLIKLTAYLGFYPNAENYSDNSCFDLVNGVYTLNKPFHNHYLNSSESRMLNDLLNLSFENLHEYRLSRSERQDILSFILDYYRLHLAGFTEIKSLEVLKMLF